MLLLERGREGPARPLAPLVTWPECAQRFGSLFPRQRVLADAFADGDPEMWPRLAASGNVNASPLIKTQCVVEAFLPDELPEETPAGSHKWTQELEVSDVACLVGAKGLIDTARKSRKRATEFVRFLVEFATEADDAPSRCARSSANVGKTTGPTGPHGSRFCGRSWKAVD